VHPREPLVRQIGFVTVAGHEGVAYRPLVGGGLGQTESGDHAVRVYH